MLLRVAIFSAWCIACAAQDFTKDVKPIFEKRCFGCHGPTQQMSGLRLDSADVAQRAASKVLDRVTSTQKGFFMPPMGPRLSDSEIAKIQQWVTASAGPVTAARSTHWAFQPVVKPPRPLVSQREWVRTPIDRFVLARLEKEKIAPSPEADRYTLIRRLSLDLTGLPPTPKEIAEFVADKRPDAYERVVDRLLISPHYGEKWARAWLDLAHYADSDGYEKDNSRPWAWRYRNWVIEALNRDEPFDQFTIEQLAGDLLEKPSVEQRVATGFLRNTLTNREAGVDRIEARFEQIVNRTNTVATTWLGLTVGCAQCHNHKFDPISQQEYYKMFAFFDHAEEEDIDAPLPGEQAPPPEYQAKRDQILEQYWVRELMGPWERRLREAHNNPGLNLEWDFQATEFRAAVDHALHLLSDDPAKRSRREWDRMIGWFVGHIGPDYAKDKRTAGQMREAREKLDALFAALPPYTQAPAMRDDPTIPPTNLRLGGDYKTLGEAVSPGTLAVLPPLEAGANASRLDFARWLVSRDHPLTARVAVNRIWQEFFGRGLVRTSEDFGTQGEKPTHPELLDWLASEFVENGWSMKKIEKMIVMSAAYRQSSNSRPDLEASDPENALIARQARLRLPAELIRDQALVASGLLNSVIGGRGIRPPQPKGVAELSYANSVKWRESTGADRYRRGLYIHYQRTAPYPQLANFDEPDSNVACARRRRSNTPLQALNLLNDPVFYETAQALAKRIEAEGGDNPLAYAYRLTVGRDPSPSERARIEQFRSKGGTWVGVARVLLNLDELITRE
ncbi:MAG TPA: PSD1 and planctomycete cytochrome C domain-containing protein [Bryobacteraceae bacterium]|nr:PSD1 and planctomycete cytochrome C domain-containing protein [Bryobacteraceae bacterium]